MADNPSEETVVRCCRECGQLFVPFADPNGRFQFRLCPSCTFQSLPDWASVEGWAELIPVSPISSGIPARGNTGRADVSGVGTE